MTAVDTNILVRLLTDDDPRQGAAAGRLFASGRIWIAKTVFLEAAWVLGKLYGFDDVAICAAFRTVLGLDNLQAEDEAAVSAALELTAQGIAFADAMHLSSRPSGVAFRSFDRAFVRRAKRVGAAGIAELGS
jgi:predicted nucleic-acid-binding protein